MSNAAKQIARIGILLLGWVLLTPAAMAQPWSPDNAPTVKTDDPAADLFTPSSFLERSTQTVRILHMVYLLQEDLRQANLEHNYEQALRITDSIIYIAENYPIRGTRLFKGYKLRAQMLEKLHRQADACAAYDRAIEAQEAILRFQQNQDLQEMRDTYQLDLQALDKTLLSLQTRHKILIGLIGLLAIALLILGVIYLANRHTRRLQQELLRQIEQVRVSEAKKSEFINQICHEVRTPLNSISGFSELLCDDDVPPEAYAQYTDIIRNCRRQLRYLFDDLLEVAALENGQVPLPLEPVALCALCRALLRTAVGHNTNRAVSYQGDISDEEITLESHRRYLIVLLTALLSNARKFTTKGQITLGCQRKDNAVEISVTDTGCGIAPENHSYVFERFTKLDTFSQGNGLGLYLCRLIVERLHGQIRIDPSYTSGTRVLILFPEK